MNPSPLQIEPPDDTGATTLGRYRYQARVMVMYCVACAFDNRVRSVVAEHIEDIAVEGPEYWTFIQIKTRDPGRGLWRLTDVLPPGKGLSSLVRAFRALNGINARFELHLEGEVKRDDLLAELLQPDGKRSKDLSTQIAHRLNLEETECALFLPRLCVREAVSRALITSSNILLLGALAPDLSITELIRIHDSLLEEITRAMEAEPIGVSWPIYITEPNRVSGDLASRVAAKRLTSERLYRIRALLTSDSRRTLSTYRSGQDREFVDFARSIMRGEVDVELLAAAIAGAATRGWAQWACSAGSLKSVPIISADRLSSATLFESDTFCPIWIRDWATGNEAPLDELLLTIRADEKILIVGETGAGKTIALTKLFLDAGAEGLFLTAAGIRAALNLLQAGQSLAPVEQRCFIDGLDEVHSVHDRILGEHLVSLIRAAPSAVITARREYVQRADVGQTVRRAMDRVLEIKLWDRSTLERFLTSATSHSSSYLSGLILPGEAVTPLFAAMMSVVIAQPGTRTTHPRWMGVPAEQILARVYDDFVYAWYRREVQRLGSPAEALPYEQAVAHWRKWARHLYRRQVGSIDRDATSVADIDSVLVKSMLRIDQNHGIESVEFIHSSIQEYFCAVDIVAEISAAPDAPLRNDSILFLRNAYSINAHVRSLLSRLQGDRQRRRSVFERLMHLYRVNPSNPDSAAWDGNLPALLRNNLMYLVGRLPDLSIYELEQMEALYDEEDDPLVRYTIGMNGIAYLRTNLAARVLEAVLDPVTAEDQVTREANLFWRLQYYGDIASTRLPPPPLEWALTQERLIEHFTSPHGHHRGFWLIDFITAVQLHQLYGGGEESLRLMAVHITNAINDDAADEHFIYWANRILTYAAGVVPWALA